MPQGSALRPWTAEDRARRLVPGRPTAATYSARVDLARYVREATNNGELMVQYMLKVMRGERIRMGKRLLDPSIRHGMAAADWLANRAYGLPKESIEVSDPDDVSRPERMTLLASLSAEDREALRTLLMRAVQSRAAVDTPTPEVPRDAGDAAPP